MVQHPKMKEWDDTLKSVFDGIDHYLEDKYGQSYSLHPNRPERGRTANPEMDGLFNVGASYTTGYGSRIGKGYVVDIHLSTLESKDPALLEKIETEVMALLKARLAEAFPGRTLFVEKEGHIMKIHGDLSLGTV
jgi:hypothetical protein